jgi:putative ATP-dependent endonuclease of OLD family
VFAYRLPVAVDADQRGEYVLLRKPTIQDFRRIKNLEWVVRSPFVALLGPDDSTKTTILYAVGLVLSSRYNATFTEADFHNCDTSWETRIDAVISDVPDSLVDGRDLDRWTGRGDCMSETAASRDVGEVA